MSRTETLPHGGKYFCAGVKKYEGNVGGETENNRNLATVDQGRSS